MFTVLSAKSHQNAYSFGLLVSESGNKVTRYRVSSKLGNQILKFKALRPSYNVFTHSNFVKTSPENMGLR